MAELTQTELKLNVHEENIPAPDGLIAGNIGAVYSDLIKFVSEGEHKRGMLLMSSDDGYILASLDGMKDAKNICILCDDITIGENEYAEVCGYFEGSFSANKLILPFENLEDDNHAELIEEIRDILRKHKIFLRSVN